MQQAQRTMSELLDYYNDIIGFLCFSFCHFERSKVIPGVLVSVREVRGHTAAQVQLRLLNPSVDPTAHQAADDY